MKNKNDIFEYHLFGNERLELDSRRRFELKVSRFSYWSDHRRVVVWMYPIASLRNVTMMLIPRGSTSLAACGIKKFAPA